MTRKANGDIDWSAIFIAIITLFSIIIGYVYTNDMGYIKESLTEIRTNYKNSTEKHDERLRNLENRMTAMEEKIKATKSRPSN